MLQSQAPGSRRQVLREHGFLIFESRAEAEPVLASLGTEDHREVLEPKPTNGRQWSHSDRYGFGAFPWHTDGALTSEPPRWMVLECVMAEESTATELLRPSKELLGRLRRCAMVVRNRTGRVRHLPAVSPTGAGEMRLRWDPRVCEVNDAELPRLIEEQGPSAVCLWKEGRILVVDNWGLLHRRPPVSPAAPRRLVRTYIER
ncbi:TauD/TfdA family dioxygenase [Serinicoccus hydrothermalis]|uniref:TauD/TfdA family dioxygenase n=1 Tax=Serinicoccus hydrothermalis TaxID=1758689 RepID=UPI0012F8C527